MLRNAVRGGRGQLSWKKSYGGVRISVISVTRGWAGVTYPGKKRYVTLEWSLLEQHNIPTTCEYFSVSPMSSMIFGLNAVSS